jgi:hypothetical protein
MEIETISRHWRSEHLENAFVITRISMRKGKKMRIHNNPSPASEARVMRWLQGQHSVTRTYRRWIESSQGYWTQTEEVICRIYHCSGALHRDTLQIVPAG